MSYEQDQIVWRETRTFPGIAAQIEPFLDTIGDVLAQKEWDPASAFAVRLALDEGIANAIEHGNQHDPEKKVLLDVELGESYIRIAISDEGVGFDSQKVKDPTL